MPDLLTPLQTISSVKSRIVALEESGPQASNRSRHGSQGTGDRPLIEIARNQKKEIFEIHQADTSRSKSASTEKESFRKGHKSVDSTVFIQQTYLTGPPTNDLSEDAREILKSQPSQEDLHAVLQYLQCGIDKKHDFNIRAPSVKASQITNTIVNETVVDHWYRLKQELLSQEDEKLKRALVSCLSSVTGVGILLAQVKKLVPKTAAGAENALMRDMVSVLEQILSPSNTIYNFIQTTLSLTEKPTQRHVVWQEFISLLAGSKILTVVAQVSGVRKLDEEGDLVSWLGNGPKYCKWLARNIAHAAITLLVKETEAWSMLAQITRRGFSLGNRDSFIAEIYSSLLLGHKSSWTAMHELLRALPRWEQKAFFDGMMRDIARNHVDSGTSSLSIGSSHVTQNRSIEAVAGLVAGIIENNAFLQDYTVEWLVDDTGANASIGLHARRAVMATLANHEEKLQRVMERCLEILSDKLRIQHASVLQQEATVQTTLLAVAYLNRLNHDLVKYTSRSSSYIHAVSNRLGSSIPRARYLGMIVGVAISRLVDEPGKVMDFGAEEMESEEGKAWLSLVNIRDKIGNLEDLQTLERNAPHSVAKSTPPTKRKPKKPAPTKPTTSKIISISELPDSPPSSPDLPPYAKPDSDPSDSEEDATLINRSKPAAPVYILDLLKNLSVTDSPETVHLALKTAPSLIRRKAQFGSELSENLDSLASTLLNLNENMSKPAPQKLRLQALIALVVAEPARMGPWLAAMYFEGDLSLVQRATLPTAIGLGCRELAGYTDTDENTNIDSKDTLSTTNPFPSKTLPPNLSAIYAPITTLTTTFSHKTIQPLALAAADTITGPNILKTRTFSSRLSLAATAKSKSKNRHTPIPKTLHVLLTSSFILPLTTRLSYTLSTSRTSSLVTPHLLALSLRTLTLLLHTLGPNASQLPTATRETLSLLLTLHSAPVSADPAVLPACLALLLCILDLNTSSSIAEERLITDFGSHIAELVSWISGLQNSNVNIPAIEGEGMPWTALAAGCQVKWQEVGRKFQGRMVGLMGGGLDGF